jgi:hypothetical protein
MNDETALDLVRAGDVAVAKSDWDELAVTARQLAALVRDRIAVLALQICQLIDDDDGPLAGGIWMHISDVVRREARQSTPPVQRSA